MQGAGDALSAALPPSASRSNVTGKKTPVSMNTKRDNNDDLQITETCILLTTCRF